MTMTRKQYYIFIGLSFFIPALLAFNYIMGHFFVSGTYFKSSGLMAYLFAQGKEIPVGMPPINMGVKSFFSFHVSPVFLITSFVYSVLNGIGLVKYNPVYFSLLYGLWFGIIGIISFFCLLQKNSPKWSLAVIALIISVLTAFNGAAQEGFTVPNYEIIIPTALFLGVYLLLKGSFFCAGFILLFGVLVREDVGILYFLILLPFALLMKYEDKDKKHNKLIMKTSFLSLCCLIASIVLFSYQKISFPGSGSFVNDFLGWPVYNYLTGQFISERLSYIFSERVYIWLPILLTFIISVWKKDLFLSVGVLALLPYLVLCLLSPNPEIGMLSGFYVVPFILIVLWPFTSSFAHSTISGERSTSFQRVVIPSVIALSSFFMFPNSGHVMQYKPGLYGFGWYGKVKPSMEGLNSFLRKNEGKITLIADEAVSSLLNDRIDSEQWMFGKFWELQAEEFPYDSLGKYNTVIYSDNYWQQVPHVHRLIEFLHLNYGCQIEGTPFRVQSKIKNLEGCSALMSLPQKD